MRPRGIPDYGQEFHQGDIVRGHFDPNPFQDYMICAGPDQTGRFLICPAGGQGVMSWIFPAGYYLSASPVWTRVEREST